MGPAELLWHHVAEDSSIASFENVIICLLITGMSVECLQASVAVNKKLAREHGGIAVLTMVGQRVSVPSPEVRKAASEAVMATHSTTRAVVQVLPGDGFWASAQRGIITAIEMVRPDHVPRKTFRELRDGVLFIATHIDRDARFARELEHAVLRAIDERAAAAARP